MTRADLVRYAGASGDRQPDPLVRAGGDLRRAPGRHRPRDVHDGAGRACSRHLGRRAGPGRRAGLQVHQAGRRTRRRRRASWSASPAPSSPSRTAGRAIALEVTCGEEKVLGMPRAVGPRRPGQRVAEPARGTDDAAARRTGRGGPGGPHRGRRRPRRWPRRTRPAGRSLVLGGGSNLVVADEGFAGPRRRRGHEGVARRVRHLRRRLRHRRRRGVVGRARRAGGRGALGRRRGAGRHPRPGRVRPRSRTSAPTGRRSPTRSRRSGPGTATAGQLRTLFPDDCGFGYRTSRSSRSPGRYVVLSVTFQLRLGDLGAPVRYAELARVLGTEPSASGSPCAEVREAVLGLRASKGMVLDADDHDTWSAGSFFTNPVLDPADVPDGAPRGSSRTAGSRRARRG